jgi:hypothetical protein
VAPPADFVPDAPAVTPILEQDAVSRGSGELLTTPAGVSGDSPGVESAAQTADTNEGDTADPELSASATPTAASGDSSPPWGLIGGGLAVGLLGAGLAFAPSKKPPLPPPPPMNPTNHYPGY